MIYTHSCILTHTDVSLLPRTSSAPACCRARLLQSRVVNDMNLSRKLCDNTNAKISIDFVWVAFRRLSLIATQPCVLIAWCMPIQDFSHDATLFQLQRSNKDLYQATTKENLSIDHRMQSFFLWSHVWVATTVFIRYSRIPDDDKFELKWCKRSKYSIIDKCVFQWESVRAQLLSETGHNDCKSRRTRPVRNVWHWWRINRNLEFKSLFVIPLQLLLRLVLGQSSNDVDGDGFSTRPQIAWWWMTVFARSLLYCRSANDEQRRITHFLGCNHQKRQNHAESFENANVFPSSRWPMIIRQVVSSLWLKMTRYEFWLRLG